MLHAGNNADGHVVGHGGVCAKIVGPDTAHLSLRTCTQSAMLYNAVVKDQNSGGKFLVANIPRDLLLLQVGEAGGWGRVFAGGWGCVFAKDT